MTQQPPPYGGDPNNPYAPQSPYGPQPPYGQQPQNDPYGGGGYQQPPSYTPPPGPDRYFGGPVQYGAAGIPARPANNPLALASMICGIAGLVLMFCWVGFLPAVAALIMGFIGRNQINQSGGAQGGSGMALTGIITGAIAVGLSLLIIVVYLVTGTLGAILNNGG